MDKDKKLKEEAYEAIANIKNLVESDYYRLKFHTMPPAGLLNDPNGFIQINGEYHLFYQLHPYGVKHGLKYWGHVKSKDLVIWNEQPIALAPSEWYETHGCYSGCAVDNNGIFTLVYTGNVKDEAGNRETYQCIAESKDGISFKKYVNNPVMINQPHGYTRHFRDPKIWKKQGIWYMVIGTQNINEEGRVLLFKSLDLKKWNMIGEVTGADRNNLKKSCYMCECPDLFELGDKDVLITCPQGLQPEEDLYNNIYQSGYFLGKLNYETGRLEHGEFIELDRGFEFYAPQTTTDDKGRRILIAWMGLPEEEEHPTVEYGWIHAMTIPRVLEIKGNKLYQKPVGQMELLRGKLIPYYNIEMNNEEIELPNINGDTLELYAEIKLNTASDVGLKIRCSDNDEEYTLLSYNKHNNKFELNRNNSGKGYGGIRRCKLNPNDLLKLHIFIDTSSVEIFINDGEEVFTSRIYPDKDSRGIKFFAKDGNAKINKVLKWDI